MKSVIVLAVATLLFLPGNVFAAETPWKQCKVKMTELCGAQGTKGRTKCLKQKKSELPGDCAEQYSERRAKKKEKKKQAKS